MKKRRELEFEIRVLTDIPRAFAWAQAMIERGLASGAVCLRLGRPRRNKDQNAKLWPMLDDVAKQCDLVINGKPVKASSEDWKDVFTASLKREQRVAVGLDGGVVFLGMRTSQMNRRDFADLIELIYAYGAEHGVKWTEPKEKQSESA